MNDYLEIFRDVVLLATFQPRRLERYSSAPRLDEVGRNRPWAMVASERRFRVPERIWQKDDALRRPFN